MRPGDILATTARPKSREGLGAVATLLSKLIQGTPYGHVGLYIGKGQMVEMLNDVGLQKGSVTALLEGRDVKVLRPQASPAQKLKAVERAERLDKKNATQVLQYDYPVLFDALATKLHLPAPKASTAEVAKRLRAGNLICSNLVTHAYAELPFAAGHSKHLVLPGDIVRSDKVREVGSFMQPKTAELAHAHESGKGIAPSQLRAGEKVELEHTHDRAAARQIAIDHLHERPDYYGLLEGLEKKPLTSKKASFKLDGEQKFRGLDIAIENSKGSTRTWKDAFGKETGSTFMHHAYGYIRRTKGTDDDHVDVYVGPDEAAENVFIVNQMRKPDFKTFDEQKVMLGFPDAAAAKAAYLKQYNDPRFFGSMKAMPFEEFKMKVLSKKNFGEKIAKAYDAPGTYDLTPHLSAEDLQLLHEHHPKELRNTEDPTSLVVKKAPLMVRALHSSKEPDLKHEAQARVSQAAWMKRHPEAKVAVDQDSTKIAFAVSPGMLSGLQHAGVGAGIGALAGGVGGAMHASPDHRGRGIVRGALAGAGLGAAGGAGIAAIKGHGAQQLATLRGSAQEAEQSALQAHQHVQGLGQKGWGQDVAHASPRASTSAGTLPAVPAAPVTPVADSMKTLPGGRGGVRGAKPLDTGEIQRRMMSPEAHGYKNTVSPYETGHGMQMVQGSGGEAFRKVDRPVSYPAATRPALSNQFDVASQQAAGAGARATALGTAANTLQQQQGVMNTAINRAGLVGAAAGTGLMGYMAVPGEYGGVSRQQPGTMPAKIGGAYADAQQRTQNPGKSFAHDLYTGGPLLGLSDAELEERVKASPTVRLHRLGHQIIGGGAGAVGGLTLGAIGAHKIHPSLVAPGVVVGGVGGALGLGHLFGRMSDSPFHSTAKKIRGYEQALADDPKLAADIAELDAKIKAMEKQKALDDRVGKVDAALDSFGIGALAAPYAAESLGHGLTWAGDKIMPRSTRLGAGLATAGNLLERGAKSMHHSNLRELGGLALVTPMVTHPIAHALAKRFSHPEEPSSAAPPTPATQAAEKVGRLLAQPGGHEKVAINIGGIASRGLSAGANFMWKNRKPIAGIAAVGAVGAGLYGGKKVIDTAKDMATEHHEPARYVGVPPGMRSPSSV